MDFQEIRKYPNGYKFEIEGKTYVIKDICPFCSKKRKKVVYNLKVIRSIIGLSSECIPEDELPVPVLLKLPNNLFTVDT